MGGAIWRLRRPRGFRAALVFGLLAAALLLAGAARAPAHTAKAAGGGTNLITNGSFEVPSVTNASSFDTIPGGSTALTGWTVGGDSVDHIEGQWSAADGTQSIDLDGNAPGSVSQQLTTTSGQTYSVDFEYSANADGAGTPTAEVQWNGTTVLHLSHATPSSHTDMDWTPGHVTVTGTGTDNLSFVSTDGAGSAYGIALDAVSVTASYQPTLTTTPTPGPLTPGTTISDQATLSGAAPGAGGTITFSAYTDSQCDTPVLHTETVSVTGNGNYSATGFVPPGAGTYYWTASYSGDTSTGSLPASEACGSESTTVTAWTGSGTGTTTVVSDGTSGPAQFTYSYDNPCNCGASGTWTFETTAAASGQVVLPWSYTGLHAWYAVTVGLKAFVTDGGTTTYTPLVAAGPDNCCTTPSNGFSYSGATTLTVPAAGDVYGFVMSGSNGDYNSILRGTLTVGSAPATTLSTTATATAALGSSITDSAVLGGVPAAAAGTIAFNAYAVADCSTSPIYTASSTVSGPGTYSAPGFTPAEPGTYYWTASYSGDAASSTPGVSDGCGSANESSTVTGLDNDAWTDAQPIALDGSGNGSAPGSIDQSGQARWYKFNVTPGGSVQVDLSNLPANYDLALFSDIGQAFDDLSAQNGLQTVSAEFAGDAFSPSVFSPSVFSPSVFSPSVFSPSVFSPSVFSPSVFSPSVFSPSVFSPSVFSPSVFSPSVFSPSGFNPSDSNPNEAIYEGAQTRSLVAISANDGTAAEHVVADVWNNTGSFYIRVNGRNGTYDPGAAFTVSVHEASGTCGGVAPSSATLLSTAAPASSLETLILADYGRMTDDGGLSTMETKLGTFAGDVDGAIVNVDAASPRVAALNTQADAHPDCPYAKNLVANAIRDIVLQYRTANPTLKYVVIVGDDNAIPFFRYPDTAGIGPESNYVPPVLDSSASQASLQSDDILSQDAYGSSSVLHLKGLDLPIPDLPVGRLVKTPTEISGLLDDYMNHTTNGVVQTPTSSLVTGYDFMTSGANAVEADLSAGLGAGATNDTLITNQGVAPSDTGTPPDHSWTADQLRTALLGQRHDLIFLAGHFSANNTLAADYSTTMNATELASSSVNLTNSIVFSAGCHSGYSIVDSDAVPGVTQTLDWTEAFAQKGATLIAGTGYQYGDTDFLAYSEQLYADFAHQLRLGTGAVAVGSALEQAKETYLSDTPNLQGIDIKSLLESTLYGLPMLSVDLPANRIPVPGSTSVVTSTTPFTTNPGSMLGLSSFDLHLAPSLTTNTVPLVDQNGNPLPSATYLSGPDGVETSPGAPTLPLDSSDVSVGDGNVLRGVGFIGGTYTDVSGITPLTGAPATELNGVHSPFVSSAFFPSRLWTVNYFGGLTGDASSTQLNLTPVQYESDAAGSLTDLQRTFGSVDLRLFYSANTESYGANTPALAAPPTISRVDATAAGGTVTFQAHVVGDPSAGIQQVWVTYTGVDAGQWESLDLTQDTTDSTLWTGTLTGLSTAQIAALQFVVQGVNGVGLVSLDDNEGSYYQPDQIPPALQTGTAALAQTALQLNSPPASGAYGSSVPVSATLTSGGSPLQGEQVSFTIGGSKLSGVTDATGSVTAQVPLVDLPGPYQLTAGFDGDTTHLGSSASAAFTINMLGTALALSGDSSVNFGADTGISATLQSGTVALPQRTVAFVLTPSGGGTAVTQTRITDLYGKASLGVVSPLAPGTYTVSAYFGDGAPIALPADPIYDSSSASPTAQLTVTPPSVSSISLAGTSPTNAGSVSWTVTFSQSVTGVSAANFSLAPTGVSGAGGISVSGNGNVYTVTATTGSGSGTLGLNLSSAAGIPGLSGTFTGQVYTIDKTAPTVSSINRASGAQNPTNASSLAFTVTFSEPVNNVAAGDFTPVGTNLSGGTGLTVSAPPVATGGAPSATWTVTVSTNGASGANTGATVGLNLSSVGTIQDPATNALAGTHTGDQTYGYDTTAPTVSSVTSTLANGSYKANQVVPITVTFSEAVNVTGTPRLTLALTPTNRAASYTSGTGTKILTFTYTVQPGDTSAHLNYAATSSLTLNGGTIEDAATNNATLTLPGLTAAGSLGTNKAIVIDTTAPTVSSINLAGSSPAFAGSVSWKVTFSEVVTGVKAANFSLAQSGLPGAGGISVSGSGTTYTVTASTGAGTGMLGLNLSTTTGIIDAAGNVLAAPFTGQVYTIAARLSPLSTSCNGIYIGAGANVVVPANGACTLLPSTVVVTVTVSAGGTLSLQGVIVRNVVATSPAGIGIKASTVTESLQVSGTKGKGPGGGDNYICQTTVGTDLVVQSGTSAASRFVIGGAPDCTAGNTVGHDLVVKSNQEPVVVANNTVVHDLTVQGNTPGGATVAANKAGDTASCVANNPQTGNGNKAVHSNTCPH